MFIFVVIVILVSVTVRSSVNASLSTLPIFLHQLLKHFSCPKSKKSDIQVGQKSMPFYF